MLEQDNNHDEFLFEGITDLDVLSDYDYSNDNYNSFYSEDIIRTYMKEIEKIPSLK